MSKREISCGKFHSGIKKTVEHPKGANQMNPRTAIKVATVIVVAACAHMARAQWSSYQSQPQYRGGMTYYNNANGSLAGPAYRTGNTTYYNSANGSSAGMFRIFLGTFSPKELKSIGKLEIKVGHMKGDRFIE